MYKSRKGMIDLFEERKKDSETTIEFHNTCNTSEYNEMTSK